MEKAKILDIVSQMTLEEKASLCSGQDFWNLESIERLNIPKIMVTDGPHGLRKQQSSADHLGINASVPSTCFPTASLLASTWDKKVLEQVGEAIALEVLNEEVGVVLGPGVNIKRSPLCGRNFEYFSEDPYITSMLATHYIQGVQSIGIGTSIKHYAVNNQEYRRMTIDSVVDERALREIYLAAFENAIKHANPWTVMSAYNKVNGVYASEHTRLLNDILRKEWGFKGIVVTDWGACNDRVLGLEAGLDLEMPGNGGRNDRKIVAAIESGELSVDVLDNTVVLLLELIFKAEAAFKNKKLCDKKVHHKLARKVASEGIVLLKNDRGILPLNADEKVAIIGEFAKSPRYQGSGSSLINPTVVDNAYDEFIKFVGEDAEVTYARGYSKDTDEIDKDLLGEAVDVASKANVVLLFVGLTDAYESEGFDRTHMKLPKNHDELIKKIAENHDNVIVVLSNGSPVEMSWVDDVSGIVEGYLGGQASGGAVTDVLLGIVNPSGKLAETFPIKLEDNPSFPNFPSGPNAVEYMESIYVGYRYYEKSKKEVLFPFGHGLSYTSFEYKSLELNKVEILDGETVEAKVVFKNTGSVRGKEVIQLYVKDIESTIFKAPKELKGFEKIELQPGEEKTVTFNLSKRDFAHYSVEINDWIVESGEFDICVGASSADIRLSKVVNVNSTSQVEELDKSAELSCYYELDFDNPLFKDQFKKLYGKEYTSNEEIGPKVITINTTLSEITETKVGEQLYTNILESASAAIGGKDEKIRLMVKAMVSDMPLRNLLMFSNGEMTEESIQNYITMMNQEIEANN